MEVRFVGNVVDRELLICCSFGKRVRFVQVLGGYLISEQMYVFFYFYFYFISFFRLRLRLTPIQQDKCV